jgi:alpha-1,3-rhamnosyl/mannosyltransferase
VTPTIGVNLLWCVPGRVGGSEEYVSRFLAELPDAAPDLRLVLYVLPGFGVAHPDLSARHELRVAPISGDQRSLRVLVESTWLARDASQRRLALVHHAGGTVPTFGSRAPVVLTMHDIQYATFPENFTPLKRRWLSHQVPAAVRRARVVTTPTAYVKRTLVDELGVPDDAITVVPHGLPERFGVAPVDDDALRRRYEVPGPFVLYPAVTYPHKNHRVLLDAFRRLPAEAEVRLVLIGGAGRGEEELQRSISASGLRGRVVRTGRVPEADRDGLLRLADALVFPSHYEGFGAPVVEAMAVGTPVLAADETALPEVVGDGGLLLPADDPDAWADAIATVLSDQSVRDRLVAAGRERAKHFSSRRSAAALADAYRQALDHRQPSSQGRPA